MAIATGSRSGLYVKTQTALNAAPTGNWMSFPFRTEGFDLAINTVQGQDIRPDRTASPLRGGNVRPDGQIVHDFGPHRSLRLMEHLLSAAGGIVSTTVTVPDFAEIAYNRGDYVKTTTAVYVCLRGGTVATGFDAGDLDAAVGTGTGTANGTTNPLRFQYVGPLPGTTIYQHVLTAGATPPAFPLSFEKQIIGAAAPAYFQWVDGKVNRFQLQVQQEPIVSATWDILALAGTKTAASGIGTPVTVAEQPFTGLNCYVHLNNTDGAPRRTVREATLVIENGINGDIFVLGERTRAELPEGVRQASGTLSIYFSDVVEYDYFQNETKVPIIFSFIHNGVTYLIELPETKLTGNGVPKVNEAGALQADYNFTAFKDTAAYDIKVTVRTTLAAAGLPV